MYHYRCQVLNIVDADTVDCLLDLGLRIQTSTRIRLWGINAVERNDPRHITAESFLRFLLIGKPLTIWTLKDKTEKYGRLLGVFYEARESRSVNQKMLDQGMAVPYMVELQNGQLPEVRDGDVLLEP